MSVSLLIEKTKVNKLKEIAHGILEMHSHKNQLINLMNKLFLTEKEVINNYLAYNTNIFDFDNDIYNSIANRFVLHMHNLLEKSCHDVRQATILSFLEKVKPKSVVDIGFGVPSRYVSKLALEKQLFHVFLNDLYDMAFQFATALLDEWDANWNKKVSFIQSDMMDVDAVGRHDVYLFQESIEHAFDPTSCLRDYVKYSSNEALFFLYLPMNAPIPAHYIVWENDKEAESWIVKCGLKVKSKTFIKPNPEVDLFADVLDDSHQNILFICTR